MPQKVAAKIAKEKVAKELDDFKFTFAVNEGIESEVTEILQNDDRPIKKYKGPFVETTKDPVGFMKTITKLFSEVVSKFELTISVERVPVKKKAKVKAA